MKPPAGRRSWWRRSLLAALLVALATVSGWALPAFAHAQLLSTSPAAGAVLARSPGTVVLHFGEDVELEFGSIRVFDGAGHRVDSGQAKHVKGDDHSVEIGVPASLPNGGYVVTWRVISADSHPVHGAFTFQIGTSANSASTSGEAAKLLASGGGDEVVGVVFGVIRALAFLALAVLVGSTAFVAGAWPAGRADKRVRRLLWGGWIASLVTTVAAIMIQGPYGAGEALPKAFQPSVVSAVLHTRFGEVYGYRVLALLVAAMLLAYLLRSSERQRPGAAWTVPATVVGLAILVTPGLAGHAATGQLIWLAIPFDLVHVTGAAVWVGGLAVLAIAALHGSHTEPADPAGDSVLAGVIPRYSQWAFAAVVAIAVSGAFAAWRQVGLTVDAYTQTTFGRLVLAKTAVFAVLLYVASTSRRLVHGRLALPGSRRTGAGAEARRPRKRGELLRRAVAVELALAMAVFGLTAVLVNSIPARSALALPFSTEVHAGDGLLLDIDIEPAKAGPVAIHAYILTDAGAQKSVYALNATIELDSAGIAPIPVPLLRAGPAHFAAYSMDIPIQGTWTLRVLIQLDRFNEVAADPINVHIR